MLDSLINNNIESSDLNDVEQIIADYRIAYRSRQISLIGRREVLSGKANFGIFGGGKEVAQVAMARAFRPGDFRSGYYRDQTFMMALEKLNTRTFFGQLYAHTSLEADPVTGGRMMNGHYGTRSLNEDGTWRDLTQQYNSSVDISPTAGQMPRLVGLAHASRLYRDVEELQSLTEFSNNGREVAFGTIGNASCAEGHFWESVNAIGVLGAPAVISIWDDEYGISVTNEHQITKSDLSTLLSGFQREGDGPGYDIYTVRGWDYMALIEAYTQAARNAREEHVPAIIHVIEMTQPQGHSTSGSHERYKSEERLEWEKEFDCLPQMRRWMIDEGIATDAELTQYEKEELQHVRREHKAAWQSFVAYINEERTAVGRLIDQIASQSTHKTSLQKAKRAMMKPRLPKRRDIMHAIFVVLKETRDENIPARRELMAWRDEKLDEYKALFADHLHSETAENPLRVPAVEASYPAQPEEVSGYKLLNEYFQIAFERDPRVVTFGEDVGFLGGVNQSMAGMQEKFGALRVADTGIRENTIMGQAIGMALRGLRPIAEIQYLDYLLYCLQTMSDDLATVRWRSVGGQKAPVIVRTRGHRLVGVWHSGSPMAGILNLVRGIHVLVPRNMTQAIGFYNTLLQGDDPGLVIEVLNGYRHKEERPDNLADLTIPLGVPEVLREGEDVTVVTYGAMCPIVMEAAEQLADVGIDIEVIDARSLLPFDINGRIVESVRKTNRLVVADEDVPGGASAFIMQKVLEEQGGYHWLDSEPVTITAQEHRPAYGPDGDYFSKPSAETVFTNIYEMMNEAHPAAFPLFYLRDGSKNHTADTNKLNTGSLYDLYR